MQRLSSARDAILAQSNRFLIAGMLFACLYGVKAVGLRIDIVVFDTKIFELPYGLFVFCVLGAGSFLIAQTRYLDAHALECRMREISREAEPKLAQRYLQTFPSEHSWMDLAREQFESAPGKKAIFLSFSFTFAGLVVLALYFFPVFASIHYLLNWPEVANGSGEDFQWWAVMVGLVLDLLFFIFVQRVYVATK